jgi:hypothetical protein
MAAPGDVMMRATLPAVLVVVLAACGPPGVGAGNSSSESGSTGESTGATESVETSSADSFDGSDTEDTEHWCGGFELTPATAVRNIMFVVDVSSSMLETWDHDQDPMTPTVSRWQTARPLLAQVLAELESQYDEPRLGLQRVPSSDACPAATVDAPNCTDADVCLIESSPEVAVGEFQAELILASLPESSASPLEVVGGSPIGAAWLAARDHLLAQRDADLSAIILFTDGGANCSEPSLPTAVEVFDEGLVALVADGYDVHGIQTLVVGVDVDEQQPSSAAQPDTPAVDTYAALNSLALAGGFPWNNGNEARKFFDTEHPDDLMLAIGDDLICTVSTCTVDLVTASDTGPPEPSQIPLIVIKINGEEIPYVSGCVNEKGWSWLEEGLILTFCGSFCDAVQAGEGIVEGIYGCPLP